MIKNSSETLRKGKQTPQKYKVAKKNKLFRLSTQSISCLYSPKLGIFLKHLWGYCSSVLSRKYDAAKRGKLWGI